MPLTIMRSPTDFFEWQAEASTIAGPNIGSRLLRLHEGMISPLHQYEFPAVVLESDLGPEVVARIFERINRTGLRLNAFDLMVARAIRPDWNLRDEFEGARSANPWLAHVLGEDGLPLLSTVALLSVGDVREAAVLRLDGSVIREQWGRAVDGMGLAIDALWNWGVISRDLVPYRAMLPVLAALLAQQPTYDRRALERWFWSRAFAKTFDVAANTKAVGEYQRLLAVKGAPVDIPLASADDLWLATRRTDGALFRAFLSSLSAQLDLPSIASRPDGPDDTRDPFNEAARVVQILPRWAGELEEPPIHLRALNIALAVRHRETPSSTSIDDSTSDIPIDQLSRQYLTGPITLGQTDWREMFLTRLAGLSEFLLIHADQRLQALQDPAV